MKISARNIFPGTIVEIQEWRNDEPRAARHRGNHHHVIDHQRAVDELKLVAGTKASSVIKSSEVMIAVWRDRIVATW